MNRRIFLGGAISVAAISAVGQNASSIEALAKHPRAITMWEFSWIERRWPGAGYEDWDHALDGLKDRGYNAVRIDPFPHLLAVDPHKTWTLWPAWNTQMWGSPDVNRIVLVPALFEFIGKCRDRGIKVGLSTWYRRDDDDTRMTITGPEV
ncbi:MAG: cellulase-like family protein, partial [Terracidiphilus sp.]